MPHRQALQTSAPTFLCRDQSKKALRGAESFSSWGIDRFADLRTHSFVQGPVKKSASGCRKFFLLGPPEFPCPLRLLAQFVHGEGFFSLASGGAELPKSRRRNFHLGCPLLNTNVLLKLKVRRRKILRDHAYENTWFLEDVMMVAMGMCAGNANLDGTFGGGISMGSVKKCPPSCVFI